LTIDSFGQLSDQTTADYSFRGDLQFYPDVDQKYISSGIIEVGQAVLYIHPDAITSSSISIQDQIIDGNAVWEVVQGLEAPELDGTCCHLSYKCIRRINSSD